MIISRERLQEAHEPFTAEPSRQSLKLTFDKIIISSSLREIDNIYQKLRALRLLAKLSLNKEPIDKDIRQRIEEIFGYVDSLIGNNHIYYLQVTDSHFIGKDGAIYSLSELLEINPDFLSCSLNMWRLKRILENHEKRILIQAGILSCNY